MLDRISNTSLGQSASDYYNMKQRRMLLSLHAAITQENFEVRYARKVSRSGRVCHIGDKQVISALTALIQITFQENHLTFLRGSKATYHVHYGFVSLTKNQGNIYTKARVTEAK